MRKVLLTVLVLLLLVPQLIQANPVPFGGFAPYADTQGTEYRLYDEVPGVMNVYIVHPGPPWDPAQATGSRFSAPKPDCMVATYVGDITDYLIIAGNSQDGISVSYFGCVQLPVHVLTVVYFVSGETPSCCFYKLLPDPTAASGEVEIVDCDDQTLYMPEGGWAMINPTHNDCGFPVEPTTWGKIKALYTD